MAQANKLREALRKNNTGGKRNLLWKVTSALKFKSNQPEKKSLNTIPSPLAAPRSPRTAPRKRALLIGVSYRKQQYELKGTINDVKKIKQ